MLQELIRLCRIEELNVYVFETYRTPQRQAWLYANGRSKLKTAGMHGKGLAVDIVFKDAKGRWSWDEKKFNYRRVAEISKSIGLTPGYYWPRFHDGAHHQLGR
jgi:hypothetical protein